MAPSTSSPPPAEKKSHSKRPQQPNKEALDATLETLNIELKAKDKEINEIAAQMNALKNGTASGPDDKRTELQNELKTLINEQSKIKTQRNAINDEIKVVDNSLKKKIKELQAARGKSNFKSADDVAKQIERLEKDIDSGNLKLVDERRHIKEISNLNRIKRDFSGLDSIQKSIDQEKEKLTTLREKLNGVQNKELNARFDVVKGQLDEIRESRSKVNDKKSVLYKKREGLHKEKDAIYSKIRAARDEFHTQRKAYQEFAREERARRLEAEKAEREASEKAHRKEVAEAKLAEASIPAFSTEIKAINTLIVYFDPTFVPKNTSILGAKVNGLSIDHHSRRKIEVPEGAVLVKKVQEDFFTGSKGKKNKKRNNKEQQQQQRVSYDPYIINQLAQLGAPVPTNKETVPETVEALKKKLAEFESNQETQTKKNVEKAKAEIAKLEKEAAEAAKAEEEVNSAASLEPTAETTIAA